MKRLVDENDPADDVLRLLIRAGANHQPSAGGKMRMMAALGLGSAVGLSASKVLAWLSTSSGKVVLGATVIGSAVAGTYVLTPPVASTPLAAASVTSPSPASRSDVPTPVVRPAARGNAQQAGRGPAEAEPKLEQRAPAEDLKAPMDLAPRLEPRASTRVAPARRPRLPSAPSPTSDPAPQHEASLAVETAWVDQLRVAAEERDRQTFERLMGQYIQRFPEGQLRPEVSRLRASLR